MFTVSLLSLVVSTTLATKSVDLCSQEASKVVPIRIAEYNPNDDPGKDLTPDPHEDVHDKNLPANNPDDYLKNDPPPAQDDE